MLWMWSLFACHSNTKIAEPSTEIVMDNDGDGFSQEEDCNDSDGTIHPAATELCDGTDNNCDGQIDEDVLQNFYADADGDGFGNEAIGIEGCAMPNGFVSNSDDCDDSDNSIYPDAEEICDGLDNNCDGEIDPYLMVDFYVDADRDGFGDTNNVVQACSPDFGITQLDGDCDDQNDEISPIATELCDGLDNNCDGQTDENLLLVFYRDQDEDGFGVSSDTLSGCEQPEGYVSNDTDCDDLESYAHPEMTEVCDGIDNDCDGSIDNNALDAQEFFTDNDGDGYGLSNESIFSCVQPLGSSLVGGDCDDDAMTAHPQNFEICDGLDNNCDGVIDENTAIDVLQWFFDGDSDGYGTSTSSVFSCVAVSQYVANADDCEDTQFSLNPETIWYLDADSDGYGDGTATIQSCVQPNGYVSDNTDCDDLHAQSHLGATEICDSLDNDCDGTIDNEELVAGDEEECAQTSCQAILSLRPSASDGYYFVDPDGHGVFEAFCDMTTSGGGWTLIASFVNGDGVYNWTQFASGTNNLPNWTNESIFGDIEDFMSADYKSPAMWRMEATDILALDDGGGYASYENALQTNLRDTLLGYNSCQTSFLTGVTVHSSDPLVESNGHISFYGADPNNSGLCPLNYGVDSTDAAVIALAHQGCGTTGFGHVGYFTGLDHTDNDYNFCLQAPVYLNSSSGCGTYYGQTAINWFSVSACSYALLLVR